MCASLGKIIVKTCRGALRATEGKNKPGRIKEPDAARVYRKGNKQGGRKRGGRKRGGEEDILQLYGRFISCSVSRGKLQRRSRFPLKMHFKRLRTNRKWHSRLYFPSCAPSYHLHQPPLRFGLTFSPLVGTTCFLNTSFFCTIQLFLSFSLSFFLISTIHIYTNVHVYRPLKKILFKIVPR